MFCHRRQYCFLFLNEYSTCKRSTSTNLYKLTELKYVRFANLTRGVFVFSLYENLTGAMWTWRDRSRHAAVTTHTHKHTHTHTHTHTGRSDFAFLPLTERSFQPQGDVGFKNTNT